MKGLPPSLRRAWGDPVSRRSALSWGAALALFGAAAFLYAAIDARARDVGAVLERKQREIRTARESGLDALGAERLAKLQKDATVFKGGFIRLAEVPAVLDGLSEQAERNGVNVVGVSAANAPADEFEAGAGMPKMRRLPITMRLEGSTKAFGEFLHALSRSSRRIFVVDRFRLAKPAPDAQALDGELTLSFFTAEGGA